MLMQSQHNPELKQAFRLLLDSGKIRAIDMAFADFVYGQEHELDNQSRDCLALLAAYASAQTGEQHSCIELNQLAQPFSGVYHFPEYGLLLKYISTALTFDVLDEKERELKQSTQAPLIVDNDKLYLQRYWHYEHKLAAIIRARAAKVCKLDSQASKGLLGRLFEPAVDMPADDNIDWQKVAVCIAASQNVSFITGGPGTGKTTTVTKLLALLQGLAARKGKRLNIQLAAPTGKAAARLTESISAAKQRLPADLQGDLPEQCQTIHRLLGAKPLSPYFYADEFNPLHLDVLVLDEASMVDLPLMTKLFTALPEAAQVILLGDQDQLASVETGSVLADICASVEGTAVEGTATLGSINTFSQTMCQQLSILLDVPEMDSLEAERNSNLLQDNVVRLVKSHRFNQHSGIGQLAAQVKIGSLQACSKYLQDETLNNIHWYQPQQSVNHKVADEILKKLIVQLLPLYKKYIAAIKQGDVRQAFEYFNQQQVLCAQKSGYWGVAQVNQLIEKELNKQGLIDNSKDFYSAKPIMLSKNDHQVKLFNGDIGIVMPDPDNSTLTKVWFITPEGELRGLLPSRLPEHETVYAMTIHKSQGSEFNSVYLCLPPIKANSQGRGINRELLYTGLTRAKAHFSLFATAKALQLGLSQQCIRGSGLAERLRN